MGSLPVSICDRGNQNRYIKPTHDVFRSLTKGTFSA